MLDPKVEWLRLKGMEEPQRILAMREYSKIDLLRVLRAGMDDLHRQIQKIPELLYDKMDERLPTDAPSRRVADEFLARLRGPSA